MPPGHLPKILVSERFKREVLQKTTLLDTILETLVPRGDPRGDFPVVLFISLHFYAFFYFSSFLLISLEFCSILFISLHFSAFLCILHFIFQDNLTERTVVLWTPFFIVGDVLEL